MPKKSNSPTGFAKVMRGAGYGLFLLFILALGTAGGWVKQSVLVTDMVKNFFNPRMAEDTFKANTVTLLILGCDEDLSVGGARVLKKQARSDMMLVVKLDFPNKLVTGVSIPRDTRIHLPGYKPCKINAFHEMAAKGHEAELTQRAVEFVLPGVKIDRVVTLDFDHFQDLVNMVGGVPLDIEKRMKYTDKAAHLFIDLKPGYQVLNGYDAMSYVRFRHADNDLIREQRQKKFLLAFKQQAMKNWIEMPKIVNEGQKVIGDSISTDELASLALFARQVPPQNIQWGQIPVHDAPRPSSDVLVDEDKLHDVLAQYRLVDVHGDSLPSTEGKP